MNSFLFVFVENTFNLLHLVDKDMYHTTDRFFSSLACWLIGTNYIMINNVTGTHFNPIYILQSESLVVNWFEYSLALFQVCNPE